MHTPPEIVVPEFDPDPTIEEYQERVYSRYELARDDVVIGYLYAEREPTAEERANALARASK